MSKSKHVLTAILVFALFTLQLSAPVLTLANPTGGSVAAGKATISSFGKIMTVNQTTNQAIINWQDFSNNKGEAVNFVQPSGSSIALNRVISGIPSNINGLLQANGSVFVINPAGIVFGSGSQVNIGATFAASTLNMLDSDFLNQQYHFFNDSKTAAGVENHGSINAGQVNLLSGFNVQNFGEITTPWNGVNLVASGQQLVTLDANGLIQMAMPNSPQGYAHVLNSGVVKSPTQVNITSAGDVYFGGPSRSAVSNVQSYSVNVNAAGSIWQSYPFVTAAITAHSVSLNANAGAIGVPNVFLNVNGSVNASAAHDVYLYTANPGVSNYNITAGGKVNVTNTAGAITGSISAWNLALNALSDINVNTNVRDLFADSTLGSVSVRNWNNDLMQTDGLYAPHGNVWMVTNGSLLINGGIFASGMATLGAGGSMTFNPGSPALTANSLELDAWGGSIGTLYNAFPVEANTVKAVAAGDLYLYTNRPGVTTFTANAGYTAAIWNGGGATNATVTARTGWLTAKGDINANTNLTDLIAHSDNGVINVRNWGTVPMQEDGLTAAAGVHVTTSGNLLLNGNVSSNNAVELNSYGSLLSINPLAIVGSSGSLTLSAVGDVGSAGQFLQLQSGNIHAFSGYGSIYAINTWNWATLNVTAGNSIHFENVGSVIGGGIINSPSVTMTVIGDLGASWDPIYLATRTFTPNVSGTVYAALPGSIVPWVNGPVSNVHFEVNNNGNIQWY